MNIVGKKNWYFLFSGIIIVIGLLFLVPYGLLLSIDFTGGSRMELSFKDPRQTPNRQQLSAIIEENKVKIITAMITGTDVTVRTDPINQKINDAIIARLKKDFPSVKEKTFETVGPIVGRETETSAVTAVIVASIMITFYIAFAFRQVSRPVSSWKFGVCAIAALLHDLLVVTGIFAILGHFFGVEVDSLFITALLTIMGFSVHDTIVVFDRIRENLKRNISLPFEKVVNNSLLETFNRSLNTSLTVVLVLFTLLVFGGGSVTWFIAALLVGIISGTYSSIFNASALLVAWYEWDKKKIKNG